MSGSAAVFVWTAVFGLIAIVDLRTRRIPDTLLLSAAIAAMLLARGNGSLPSALIAGAAGFGMFWLLRRLSLRRGPAAFGGGDVKLAGVVGLVVGPSFPVALIVGTGAGAAVALALLASGRSRRAFFPYGPALALGAVVALLSA